VVESLAYRAKISCCIEGPLRKAAVRTLVNRRRRWRRVSFCLIGTKLCVGQPVRSPAGRLGQVDVPPRTVEVVLVIVLGSKFKRPLQPDRFLRVYAHRFLESKQGNLCLRLIVNAQRFDALDLDTRFIRIERRAAPSRTRSSISRRKSRLTWRRCSTNIRLRIGSERLTEAHSNFSAKQALLIRHALLRGFFLVLRHPPCDGHGVRRAPVGAIR